MDDVKVHYNSDKPTQLQAHAYAQGTDIHVAPGQEKHLPHEAWHVVQQKQGRVQPTMQMKEGVAVNDDKGLESEADRMGGKAFQFRTESEIQKEFDRNNFSEGNPFSKVAQKTVIIQCWKVHYRGSDGISISAEDRLRYLSPQHLQAIANGKFKKGGDDKAREEFDTVFLEVKNDYEIKNIVRLAQQMISLAEMGATEEGVKHVDTTESAESAASAYPINPSAAKYRELLDKLSGDAINSFKGELIATYYSNGKNKAHPKHGSSSNSTYTKRSQLADFLNSVDSSERNSIALKIYKDWGVYL